MIPVLPCSRRELASHRSMSAFTPPAVACASGMKFVFEISTNPTLHAVVAVAIVVSSSTSLAAIAVAIGNPTVSVFCAAILAFIILLVLVVPPPVDTTVTAKLATTSLNKSKTT